ncbi:helix-turn-helix transcriptional regulator [Pseudomonas sp. 2023EL-01195]|uniref:response regulator transcription factor n=1 Tax=Pseudomonas sp. 2023EL-01195 TaxID=3088134 RepID=UPI00296B13D3|nr:helix-turn-helix transcriptional regulator [Pseudomonas sp. 2023EL-01195]MDW3714108.1 helix-turn-helix transcriptional regulator [Pseudomonas sp. 2023EL-01195]
MEVITAFGFTGFLGRGAAPRELECLLAVAGGLTSKEAARDLGVAPGTIEKRLLALSTKLGVTRRGALVAEAFRRGVIVPAACIALAFLVGLQQNPNSLRRPSGPRRVETFTSVRRIEAAWVA